MPDQDRRRDDDRPLVVLSTVATPEQGEALAGALLAERLAGCVQLLPPMRSMYTWRGALCNETEQLLVIKTVTRQRERLLRRVAELHPYEEPEILALPTVDAAPGYAAWLDAQID
jgi:periplasmic divalent cation tolerance protein